MSAIAAIRPLLLLCISSFFLMASHGLSGLLLPVNLKAEGVDVQAIGIILSLYSVGYLGGAVYAKKIIKRIGLVRTFAMCGSLAATAILFMGLDYNDVLWGVMRAVMGFCIACATATLDTWYNSVSTESNRGKVLAVNQVVILSAITLGQFGLLLAPPSENTLFIICGLLFSISISPLVFISHFEPKIETVTSISFKELFLLSPLGFVACLLCGVLYSVVINIMPLYTSDVGMTQLQISIFMGAATAGGIVLQIPIGYLSDRFERRKVILGACCTLLVATFMLAVTLQTAALFYVSSGLVAVMMGIIACLYPLSISETFDRAVKDQMVPVLSSLLCIYAVGSIIGPYTSSMVIKYWGNESLFMLLCALELALVLFILYRMSVRQARPVEEQESFVMHSPSSFSEDLDPRVEYQEQSFQFEQAVDELSELLDRDDEKETHEGIRYLRNIAQDHPEWFAPLIKRLPDLSRLDLISLYRALALSNPDSVPEFVSAVTESAYQEVERLVDWLIEKEPEGSLASLAAIARAGEDEDESLNIIETLVAEHPEKILEFTQELVGNVVEESENMRPADREAEDIDYSVAELISAVEQEAPEHSEEVVEYVTEAIEELNREEDDVDEVEYLDEQEDATDTSEPKS